MRSRGAAWVVAFGVAAGCAKTPPAPVCTSPSLMYIAFSGTPPPADTTVFWAPTPPPYIAVGGRAHVYLTDPGGAGFTFTPSIDPPSAASVTGGGSIDVVVAPVVEGDFALVASNPCGGAELARYTLTAWPLDHLDVAPAIATWSHGAAWAALADGVVRITVTAFDAMGRPLEDVSLSSSEGTVGSGVLPIRIPATTATTATIPISVAGGTRDLTVPVTDHVTTLDFVPSPVSLHVGGIALVCFRGDVDGTPVLLHDVGFVATGPGTVGHTVAIEDEACASVTATGVGTIGITATVGTVSGYVPVTVT